MYGTSHNPLDNASAIQGELTASASGVDGAGVYGKNDGTNANGCGVKGTHAGGGSGGLFTSTGETESAESRPALEPASGESAAVVGVQSFRGTAPSFSLFPPSARRTLHRVRRVTYSSTPTTAFGCALGRRTGSR